MANIIPLKEIKDLNNDGSIVTFEVLNEKGTTQYYLARNGERTTILRFAKQMNSCDEEAKALASIDPRWKPRIVRVAEIDAEDGSQ